MNLDDVIKSFSKLNEQQNTLTKLGSIETIISKTLEKQQIWGTIGPYNWFGQNDVMSKYFADYNTGSKSLPKHLLFGMDQFIVRNSYLDKFRESWSKNNFILSNIASIVGSQNSLIEKTANDPWLAMATKHQELFNSVQSLSGKVAIMGLGRAINESYYLDAETITSGVSELVKDVNDQTINLKDFTERFLALLNFAQSVLTKGDPQVLLSLWLSIIGIFLSAGPYLHQQNTQMSQDGIHISIKQEKEFKDSLKAMMSQSADRFSVKMTIDHSCKLYLKNKLKSSTVGRMLEGDSVLVINTCGKWASIMFIDKNGFPVSGFLLKKYLRKSKIK